MRLFLTALCLIILTPCVAQNPTPGAYMSSIGKEYQEISKDMMSYVSAAAHGKSARKIDKRRSELLQQMKSSERTVRMMKPFQGNTALRDSVANYFRLCQIVLREDYGKILDLEDIAEQSYDAMEAYMLAKDKAEQKLDEASGRVDVVYRDFAKTNNITLVESDDKLSQKMKKAGEVNRYYQNAYLIFFKSYKNELYFLDAMNKGDVNAMEQTRENLLKSCEADLPRGTAMTSFEGDGSLKNSVVQLLNFYKREATTNFTMFIDFQLKKDNFDKLKKAIDNKPERDRTQKDLDTYNKAVAEFNGMIKKVNAANDEGNKTRTNLLNTWNTTSAQFQDKHTPTYR